MHLLHAVRFLELWNKIHLIFLHTEFHAVTGFTSQWLLGTQLHKDMASSEGIYVVNFETTNDISINNSMSDICQCVFLKSLNYPFMSL